MFDQPSKETGEETLVENKATSPLVESKDTHVASLLLQLGNKDTQLANLLLHHIHCIEMCTFLCLDIIIPIQTDKILLGLIEYEKELVETLAPPTVGTASFQGLPPGH